MKLLIATYNPHKAKEIKNILEGADFEIHTLDEFDFSEVIEDGKTLLENATKKATEYCLSSSLASLSDDTGFFVEVLDGKPGIYAARFAGEDCNFADNRKKVLKLLDGKTNRNAYFETVAVFADKGGVVAKTTGRVDGVITCQELGNNGFGYDSIFIPNGSEKTFAQMTDKQKESFSHRTIAIKKIAKKILEYKK